MRLFQAVAIACAVIALAACGEGNGSALSSTTTPAPGPTRSPLSSPVVAGLFTPAPGSIYFGAYVNSTGLLGGNTPADTADFEAQLGRLLTLHMQYLTFYGSLSGNRLLDDFVHYRVPVISWNCQYPNAQIASGQLDSQLQIAAAQAKNFGAPMFIRYFYDVNLPGTTNLSRATCWDQTTDLPNQVYSPTQFIAAWQRMHQIFVNAGATNVIWVWAVSADAGAQPAMPYYPGPGDVDWVGLDAYDGGGTGFASTFSSLYPTLAALNKPMMIETGATGTDQQAFFSAGVSALKSQFPAVKAFVYNDSIDYVTTENQDWRVIPAAFPSFSTFANDPYLGAKYAP